LSRPYWEGKFDKGEATYTLTITSDDVPEDSIRQVLSTMVSVPQGDSIGKVRTTPKAPNDAPRTKENDPSKLQKKQDVPEPRKSTPPKRDSDSPPRQEKVPQLPDVPEPHERNEGATV
jgi:hypothetical protein